MVIKESSQDANVNEMFVNFESYINSLKMNLYKLPINTTINDIIYEV